MDNNLTLRELRDLMAKWETRQGKIAKRWKGIIASIETAEIEIRRIEFGDSGSSRGSTATRGRKPGTRNATSKAVEETGTPERLDPTTEPAAAAEAPKRRGRKPGSKNATSKAVEETETKERSDPLLEPAAEAIVAVEGSERSGPSPEPATAVVARKRRGRPPKAVAPNAILVDSSTTPEQKPDSAGVPEGTGLLECLVRVLTESGDPMKFDELSAAVAKAGFTQDNIGEWIQAAILNGPFRETVGGVMLREPKAPAKPLADLFME